MNQPWFVNCVIEARTSLNPHELLIVLQDLEKKMGRVRIQKWGPRLIDLDILFYGQAIIQDRDLIIPHPELHKRRFVLVPFNEIASYWIHPVFGISVKGLLDRVLDESKVERIQGE
jgi:2-amino-4-hydroxy-6-hydroxymethyldihydropteridine diphosphokinase